MNNNNNVPASKFQKVIFWITTGLILFETAVGAYWDLAQIPFVQQVFKLLGFPSYFLIYMGIGKALGVIVFFLPGFTRLKEWIYAGLFFTYSAAAFSHAVIGDYGNAISPLVLTLLTVISWRLHPIVRSNMTMRMQPSF